MGLGEEGFLLNSKFLGIKIVGKDCKKKRINWRVRWGMIWRMD